MKVRTSELKGAALDWAVAKCAGLNPHPHQFPLCNMPGGGFDEYRPSEDWSQGGPIIEREAVTIECRTIYSPLDSRDTGVWWFSRYEFQHERDEQDGPTPLIAAMRAYVAKKLGNEIEIPEELTK